MSRRGSKSPATPLPGPRPRPGSRAPARLADPSHHAEAATSHQILAERLRRFALGATAALVTARAFWPSESDMLQDGGGNGLTWTLALFIVTGLALASSLIGGTFRIRWSWGDAAFLLLVILVAYSAQHAMDRRPAINLAWEWIGIGLAYFLYRNLPTTRQETTALARVLVATAVAVAVYGIYQGLVELPELRAEMLRNPRQLERAMRQLNIAPGTSGEAGFRDRLLGSTEAMSTFGLANSLAVFLVGPLVLSLGVLLNNLRQHHSKTSRWSAIAAAIPLFAILLFCLNLTKSRSAYIGLFLGVGLLAWHIRKLVAPRILLIATAIGLTSIVMLLAAGLATGQLDREVFTQTPMSLRYRLEYWQATWALITHGASTVGEALRSPILWQGLGPGNFRIEYLKYKLPQASEEILDPHNLFLEVWATAGCFAMFAALVALGTAFWNLRSGSSTSTTPEADAPDLALQPTRWIIFSAATGWVAVLFVGDFNLFEGDLFVRWLILGISSTIAILLGTPLWERLPIPAYAFGAAGLAVTVNLLAVGGIGIPAVSLSLWTLIALGLNVSDDRPCSVHHIYQTRIPAFVLLIVWAAVLGTFVGSVIFFWKSQSQLQEAELALKHSPPKYEIAIDAYESAINWDRYSIRPFLGLARLYWDVWNSAGAKVDDDRWKTIPILLLKAASPPRNPESWSLHRDRARFTTELLAVVGSRLSPRELITYRASIVEAIRTASRLYPTNSSLHAWLAAESAQISMYRDAVHEAEEALRLDQITPHLERKLPAATREQLQSELPVWAERARDVKAVQP